MDSFEDIKFYLESSYQLVLGKEVCLSRHQIGPPLGDMIELLTPGIEETNKQAIIKEFRNSYDTSSYELTKEVDGSKALLLRLSRLNKRLFLVTNKLYKPTSRILKKMNMNLFEEIVTPDKFENKRLTKSELIQYLIKTHDLDLTKTVMIGDTSHDVIAAKANFLDSISVLDGYDSIENLKNENPTFMVNSIVQLQSKI